MIHTIKYYLLIHTISIFFLFMYSLGLSDLLPKVKRAWILLHLLIWLSQLSTSFYCLFLIYIKFVFVNIGCAKWYSGMCIHCGVAKSINMHITSYSFKKGLFLYGENTSNSFLFQFATCNRSLLSIVIITQNRPSEHVTTNWNFVSFEQYFHNLPHLHNILF